MISNKASKPASSLPFPAIDSEEILSTIFNDTVPPDPATVDNRRRLEDRLETLRLRREMREFDFEFDG